MTGPAGSAGQARWQLDRSVRRSARGRLLVGGAPARMIRLSGAGAAALDALLAGRAAPGAARLGERLRDAGLIHPVARPAPPPDVTVVVPVRDGGPGLGALVGELGRWGEVIVVDDGSRDDSAAQARHGGARVVANRGLPGPAGARNTGLALAATEYVAFVDADCRPGSGWLSQLAALLDDDPGLAIAAPRVRGLPGPGAVARYETGASPLDMGPDPALVGPGRRVGFVPSAALLTRREALREVGGFDEGRRVGEDVDLVLRLLRRGWRIRYAPEAEVGHRSRETLAGLMRQRFSYARSAAELDRTHPGAVAPLRISRQALATYVAVATGPRAGLVAITCSVLAAASRGRDADARRALALLTLRSLFIGHEQLARAIVRDWLPITIPASLCSPRARRIFLIAALADLTRPTAPQRQPLPLRALLRQADHLSYATGLWLGAITHRSPGAISPLLIGRHDRLQLYAR